MKFQKHLLALLLLAVTIIPRLVELNSFVAVDEPAWLTRGGNFYYAITHREFQNTVYEYHPSVITMWYVASAMFVYFPEYRGLGQGYFDVDKDTFDPFLLEHGKLPLTLLYISRLFQVIVISLFVILVFYFLSRLIGEKRAFFVSALTSSAPYFLGHSRLLSHEAMVAIFSLASILGMMVYLESDKKWCYLLLSAAAAAVAQLTKSSAMAMFPVIGLMLLVSVLEKMKERGFKSALVEHLKIFGIWFALMVLVYFVVWPGMWVAPGKMLYEVYGNAFSYAFQGSRLQVTQELQPSRFTIDSVGTTAALYVTNIFESGTIITWLGVLLAAASLFLRGQNAPSNVEKKLLAYLFTAAVMFVLLFSVAQGLNYRHYVMTSHVSMSAIGALGWVIWLGWLGTKWEAHISASRMYAVGAVLLIALQFAESAAFYPYYYTYYNPIIAAVTGNPPASNYGEGIEMAAAYLAQKPDSESLKVFSYRGRGPFSYFFPGKTIILNPMFMDEPGMPAMFERLEQADYVVITDTLAFRSEGDGLFVQALKSIPSEHSIYLKGVTPIHIFRVADLPPSFYETLSK
jgi:4-amino-4-deoxy-L-arabinose transferase-like glycosyltransferase